MSNVVPIPRSEALAQRVLRAVLYGRASKDRQKRGRSIRDQFAVGEMECADRGWQIIDRYEDRDRSATRRATKVREDFERMIADAEADKFDVIVYAESSRLARNLHVSLQLRDLCVATGILLCYNGRVYDMRVPADFKEFTRDSVQSEEEGESIIARNVRTARLAAQRGGIWGGVPFGYMRQYDPTTGELLGHDSESGEFLGQVAHPEEAPILVELFARADARHSLNSLVPLVRPFRPDITAVGIRAILRNKSYIGIRTHHDAEHKAVWVPLVDEGVFFRVQAVLDDPSRRTTHTSGVRHLMSGTAMCATCRAEGAFMQGRLKSRGAQPKYRRGAQYCCRVNHMSIMEELLDAYVEEAVLAYIRSERARLTLQEDSSEQERNLERNRAKAMAQQLEEAQLQATDFDPVTGMPKLSVASLAALERRLIPMIEAAERRARELMSIGDPLLDELLNANEDELDDLWEGLAIEQRRHVIRRVVRVELLPAVAKGYGRPVSERVRLILPGQPGFAEWPAPVA